MESANKEVSTILMRWADKMFTSFAMVQKVSAPWYSLHQKRIEAFFNRITRNQNLDGTPKNLKEFLSLKFPKVAFKFNGDGNLNVDLYLFAYIGLVAHWCCHLNCERAKTLLTEMDRRSQHIIGTILKAVTGKEEELTCSSLQVIIVQSVEESAYQTPDSSMADYSVEPTPKTKRLNELTAEVRELFAKLLTKDFETDDVHDELRRIQEEHSRERTKLNQQIRNLQSRLSEVQDNSYVGVNNEINPIIRQLESELAKCREIIDTQRKIMEGLDADIECQRQTIENLTKKLSNHASIAIHPSTSVSSSIETRDVENLAVERLKTEIYSLKKEIERLTDHVDEKEARRLSLLTRNDNLVKSEARQKEKVVKISNEYDRFAHLADEKVEKLKKLRINEVRQLKEQIDALESSRIFYLKLYNDARKQLPLKPIIVGEEQSVKIGANMPVVDEGDCDFDDETQNASIGTPVAQPMHTVHETQNDSSNSIGISFRNPMASSTQMMNYNDNNDSIVDLTNETLLQDDEDENESDSGLHAAGANNNPVENELADSGTPNMSFIPAEIPREAFNIPVVRVDGFLKDGDGYIYTKSNKSSFAGKNGRRWQCLGQNNIYCPTRAYTRPNIKDMAYISARRKHNHKAPAAAPEEGGGNDLN